MSASIHNVIFQHAENACALWLQRHYAVNEPHYTFDDIENLDNRVTQNLQGLKIAGKDGLNALAECQAGGDAGAVFAQAVLLLETAVTQDITAFIDSVSAEPEAVYEIGCALAWIESTHLASTVKMLLDSDESVYKMLGLYACDAHGRTPTAHLKRALLDEDEQVREVALNLCANQAVVDLLPALQAMEESLPKNRFALARALAFLGERQTALKMLKPYILSASTVSADSLDLAMCLTSSEEGRRLLQQLNEMPDRTRDVIRGFGMLGDPRALGWLVEKTSDAPSARLAGGAISLITGVDLAGADLESLDEPEGFTAGPDDDASVDDVALDEDENLPWPNPVLIGSWCQQQTHLQVGKIYLAGMERNAATLNSVLSTGQQRLRNAASLALALTSSNEPYKNTRLPASRQRAWMGQ